MRPWPKLCPFLVLTGMVSSLGGGARFVGTRPDAGVYEVQASCAP